MDKNVEMERTWDKSFKAQIRDNAYNTAPVEALVRTAAYYMRARYSREQWQSLHVMEMGCGAGPNLIWAAAKGCGVSGIDISKEILPVCVDNIKDAGFENKIRQIVHGSVSSTPFASESFDIIFESCVFQHLDKGDRIAAFSEVKRLLKKGGAFIGHMLDRGHTIYRLKKELESLDDPGTLFLNDHKSGYYLSEIGLAHFFSKDEFFELLDGFSTIDPCLLAYYIPKEEAKKRGYNDYMQSMWNIYAVK